MALRITLFTPDENSPYGRRINSYDIPVSDLESYFMDLGMQGYIIDGYSDFMGWHFRHKSLPRIDDLYTPCSQEIYIDDESPEQKYMILNHALYDVEMVNFLDMGGKGLPYYRE